MKQVQIGLIVVILFFSGIGEAASSLARGTVGKTGLKQFAIKKMQAAKEVAQTKADELAFSSRATKKGIPKNELAKQEVVQLEQKLDDLQANLKKLEAEKTKRSPTVSAKPVGLEDEEYLWVEQNLSPKEIAALEHLDYQADMQNYGMPLQSKIGAVKKEIDEAAKKFKSASSRQADLLVIANEKKYADLLAEKNRLQKVFAQHKSAQKQGVRYLDSAQDQLKIKLAHVGEEIRAIESTKADEFETVLQKYKDLELPIGTSTAVRAIAIKPVEKLLSSQEGRIFLRTEKGRNWLIENTKGHDFLSASHFASFWLDKTADGARYQLVSASRKIVDDFFKNPSGLQFTRLKPTSFEQEFNEMLKRAQDKIKISYENDVFLAPHEVSDISLAREINSFQQKIRAANHFDQLPLAKNILNTTEGKAIFSSERGKAWLASSDGQAWLSKLKE